MSQFLQYSQLIDQAGRFHLWSVARDTIRSWDGLLSVDWIGVSISSRGSKATADDDRRHPDDHPST